MVCEHTLATREHTLAHYIVCCLYTVAILAQAIYEHTLALLFEFGQVGKSGCLLLRPQLQTRPSS